ncbi:MAG: hypothetical protein Q4A24_02460 [Akkermansia sp.]|nr:hypothetical protein [Akkermansia sp.]
MKVRNMMIAALLAAPAFADTAATTNNTVEPLANEPALSAKRLKGSLTVGYDTNYTGRGYVVSHSVAQGDSVGYTALKLNYDMGKESAWSLGHTLAYHVPMSGHTLYGNPDFSTHGAYLAGVHSGEVPATCPYPGVSQEQYEQMVAEGVYAKRGSRKIKNANIENQLTLMTELKYTAQDWNVAFGHTFIHGGLLGVMAKHYRDQGASVVNEVFIAPEWTPSNAKWFSAGVKTSFSFQGITGWWFEPYVTFKAPVFGEPLTDNSMLAVVTFAMSATADYFDSRYFACANGSQAFWVKLSTPWFVKENVIITPSVSFNWLGRGGMKANTQSEFKQYTGNDHNHPFRNFGVVFGVSATYTF